MSFWTLKGHAGDHDRRDPQLGLGFPTVDKARAAWEAAGCPRIWGAQVRATEHSPSGRELRTVTLD